MAENNEWFSVPELEAVKGIQNYGGCFYNLLFVCLDVLLIYFTLWVLLIKTYHSRKFAVVPKKNSVFIFQVDCWKVTLYGDKLTSRYLSLWSWYCSLHPRWFCFFCLFVKMDTRFATKIGSNHVHLIRFSNLNNFYIWCAGQWVRAILENSTSVDFIFWAMVVRSCYCCLF